MTEVQEADLAYGPSTGSSSTLWWPKAGEARLLLATRDFGGLVSIQKKSRKADIFFLQICKFKLL